MVEKTDGCWLWKGHRERGFRYGTITYGGRNGPRVKAHRLSWEMHYGPIPDWASVLHKCDNMPCVRPDHLFLGTGTDNMQDMVRKGRGRPGSTALSADQVAEIKSRLAYYKRGLIRALSKEYEVSFACISHIHTGYTWSKNKGGNSVEIRAQ